MSEKKVYVKDVEPLIAELDGNIAAIARELGVSRMTIHNRINESPGLKERLHDARETMVDKAESVLYDKVLEGDTTSLIFFLKTQGKGRGYTERQEVTGADGDDVVFRVIYGDDGTNDQAS